MESAISPAFQGIYLHQCGFECCKPLHSFGPAVRDHTLIHLVLEGKGRFQSGGKTYSLRSGQGFLILPDTLAAYTADFDDPWEYCWVGFSGWDVPSILKQCGISAENPVFSFSGIQEMRSAVTAIRETASPDTNPFSQTARLFDFFALLSKKTGSDVSGSKKILAEAEAYIARNYSYHITVANLAYHLGIDRTHLFRVFKSEKNCSPQQFLLDYKLRCAADLLQQTRLSITEVMASCGFSDLPNFSKQFKKKYGSSPARYRAEKLPQDNSGKI